jgi:hypothetical protein
VIRTIRNHGYDRSVSRRLTLLLVVALVVPALALAAPGEPKEQFTAADQRKAASIVLKSRDFAAGWNRIPSTPEDDERLSCPGYNPDESDLILTGKATAEFQRSGGVPTLQSFSNVYRTKANAVASWTRSVKPALARCAAEIFKKQLASTGAKATILRQGAIAFPKVAPRTAAFRVALRITVQQNGQSQTVPITVHLIALGNGRGDSGLITVAVGNGVPLADLRAFANVTASRLAAAKL